MLVTTSYVNLDREVDSATNVDEWLKTENQTWVEFNDTQVRKFDFSKLAYYCFGETPSGKQHHTVEFQEDQSNSMMAAAAQNAYMLMYEKRVKQPVTIQLSQDIISVVE